MFSKPGAARRRVRITEQYLATGAHWTDKLRVCHAEGAFCCKRTNNRGSGEFDEKVGGLSLARRP